MALLDADEIYIVARHAGFAPAQAVTMTAIALAESRGDDEAHNAVGENSWGLWQINLGVHRYLVALGDPTDPLVNARMAYAVSREGTDIRPWTVTHGSKGALYLQYRDEAERAAQLAEPDVAATGMWRPPDGYHADPVGAGPAESTLAPPGLPDGLRGSGDAFLSVAASQVGHQMLPAASGPSGTGTFLDRALAQQGDSYVFGAEVQANDDDPDQFDCSELVQWAAAQAGVQIADGSWIQYQHVRNGGGEMTVEDALRTPGALLFRFGSDPDSPGRPSGAHVAISLGDGRTIEARGSAYGVGVFDASNRNWTHGGAIPELAAAQGTPLVPGPVSYGASGAQGAPGTHGVDSDGDTILDQIETAIGTNPFAADTDRDGFVDSVELLDYRTDPTDHHDNARDLSLLDAGLPAAAPPSSTADGSTVDAPVTRPAPTIVTPVATRSEVEVEPEPAPEPEVEVDVEVEPAPEPEVEPTPEVEPPAVVLDDADVDVDPGLDPLDALAEPPIDDGHSHDPSGLDPLGSDEPLP